MKGIFKAVVALVCAFGSINIAHAQTTPNLGLGVPSAHSLNWGPVVNGNFTALDRYLSGGLALPAGFWSGANAGTASALFAAPTLCSSGQATTGIDVHGNALGCFTPAGGGGSGTVTSFSSTATVGTLFTTSVANSTTAAAQTITLTAAPANSVFGNFTGASATPAYSAAPVFSAANLTNFPTLNQSTTGNAATATVATSALAAPYSGLTGSVPTWNQSTTGNAATASALAGTPTLCSTGNAPTGILANGNATGCASIAAGGISALTGDATASGSGSVAVTVVKINGTSLAGLATGILKNTTATGVPSIAVAGDFPTLNQNTTGTASNITGTLTAASEPAHTGDATNTAGSLAMTVKGINGVLLSGLAPGIVKNTTTTGVPSIAVAADFPTLNQSTTGNAATATALAGTPTLCTTGNAPTGILANGNATGCAAISGGSISGLTTGFIPKASSATAIANSLLDDSITTAATLTYSGTGGISAKTITLTGSSGGGGGAFGEGTAPTGAASIDDLWADSTSHRFKMINNNGSAVVVMSESDVLASAQMPTFTGDVTNSGLAMTLASTAVTAATYTNIASLTVDAKGRLTAVASGIANVTITGPTSAIAANTCTTAATVTMTGVTTSMAFTSAFATSPVAVTGWGANGGLALALWPTSNTVNWSVCNQTAASITPGAMTFNVGAR